MPTNHDPPDTHDDESEHGIAPSIEEEDLDPTGELAGLNLDALHAELDAIDIHDPSPASKWVGGPEALRRVDGPDDDPASA